MKLSAFFDVILLLSLLLTASCEYKPKGDYFRDLIPNPPGNVWISIQNHSDTLILTTGQTFLVNVDCGSRKVLFYRMYIDSVQKVMQQVSSNSFSIFPSTLVHSDGIYRLTIEAGINTGSGSIADVLGAEGYLFRKDFILVVMLQQAPFEANLRFSRSSGTLKITLDIPTDVTLVKKITLSRRLGGTSVYQPFATIPGSNHFETTDPMYVGQDGYYLVQTYAGNPAGTMFFPYVQGDGYADFDLPDITAGNSARGYPLLTWKKTHYTANCGGYRIYVMPAGTNLYQLQGTISNNNDTTFESTGSPFPGVGHYRVASVPQPTPSWFTDDIAVTDFSKEVYCYSGLASFSYYSLTTPDGPYLYYTSGSSDINEFSAETGNITNVIHTSTGWFYTYSVSPNRHYLLAATGTNDFSYLFYDLQARQSTLIPSSQVIGAGAETGIISVADNGIASVTTGNRIVIFDFLHQGPVTQLTMQSNPGRTLISSDGQYVFVETNLLYLYKIVSGALQQKWSSSGTSGTIRYYNFYPAQPSKAVIFAGQTFSTMNCETQLIEGSFVPDIDDICNIDFGNGHILGKNQSIFKVIDPVSGNLQFQNAVQANTDKYSLRIKNNTVYYSGGKKLIVL